VRRLALAAAILAGSAAAAEPPVLWHTQVDNDFFFHTDRWYSSGVRIARSVRLQGDEWHAQALRAAAVQAQRFDVGVVQEVYTADGRADASRPDRPNAARLQLSLARHDIAADRLVTLACDAGVSGPSALGEQAQDFFHRLFPAPKTDWSRQVGDRADVQALGTWSQRVSGDALPGTLVLHAGGVAGTLTAFGHAGIEWRWRAPSALASPLLRHAPTPALAREDPGLSAFAGASVRVFGRQRLYERRDDDPQPVVAFERQVYRVAAGIGWSAAWGALTLGLAQDSREFEGQRAPHRFGSLTLAIALD